MSERDVRPPTAAEEAKTIAEVARIEAETRKIEAETDEVREGRKRELEENKLQLEVEKAAVDLKKSEAELTEHSLAHRAASIMVAREERQEQDELARDKHHHRYVFGESVSDASVNKCIQQLTTWTRQAPEAGTVEILINSPGGSIFAGFTLVDYLLDLRANGWKIKTKALGMAASMGGVLLQAGDERVMSQNCFLLIHEGSLGAVGDFGSVQDTVTLMEMMHDRILALFVERAKEQNPKTTKTFIKRNWARKDWWLSSEEALRLGFVDRIE